MNIARLHANLLFTILALVMLCTIVCFMQAMRNRNLTPLQRAGFWMAELLMVAESALGGILWLQSARPLQPTTHLIYAFVALILIPFGLTVQHDTNPRRAQLRIGVLSVFLIAILLRSLQTGRFSSFF
jgi:hypothetical protein